MRAKAAKALGQLNAAAAPAVTDMLGAFVRNVAPTYPFEKGFNWSDPLQIANGYLSEALFKQLGGETIKADKNLLYPAVRAGIKHPAGMWRDIPSGFVRDRLELADIVALAPDLFADALNEGPCDRMFTSLPAGSAMAALSKHKIDEGIDISLGTITDFMVLKITANDSDTKETIYQIGGIDHQWQCKFDVAEILGYSRTLTAQEESSVGGYLAAKYGIKTAYPQPSNSHPATPETPRGEN